MLVSGWHKIVHIPLWVVKEAPCPFPHLPAAVMGLLCDLGTVLILGLPTCCASPLLLCPALKAVPGEMCLLFFLLSGELLWPGVQLLGGEKLEAFPCSSVPLKGLQ